MQENPAVTRSSENLSWDNSSRKTESNFFPESKEWRLNQTCSHQACKMFHLLSVAPPDVPLAVIPPTLLGQQVYALKASWWKCTLIKFRWYVSHQKRYQIIYFLIECRCSERWCKTFRNLSIMIILLLAIFMFVWTLILMPF